MCFQETHTNYVVDFKAPSVLGAKTCQERHVVKLMYPTADMSKLLHLSK